MNNEQKYAIAKLADMEVQQEIDMDNAWMANATPEEIAEIMGEDISDECPSCQSLNTVRIDTAVEDADFTLWVAQCKSCGEPFNVAVEHPQREG